MTITIREFILKNEISAKQERIEILERIGSPAIIIKREHELLDELMIGKLKVGGDRELLNENVRNFKNKRGNGGTPYIQFNDGEINYFPYARYGRYIKKGGNA